MSTGRALLKNTSFSVAADIVNRASNMMLWVIIAWFLGVQAAGSMALAIAFTFVATRLSFWGLDQLLTREVARDRDAVSRYTVNFLLLRLVFSVTAMAVVWLALHLVSYSQETERLILLMSLTILPENVSNICQAVFIAHERLSYLASVELMLGVFKVVGSTAVLALGQAADTVVWVLILDSYLGMTINLWLVWRKFHALSRQLDVHFCWRQIGNALPFFVSSLFYVLDNRLDVILLSFFHTESVVGIYSAAASITMALMILPQAYRTAVFAPMSRLYATSRQALEWLYNESFRYLMFLALPITGGVILLAKPLTAALYSPEFIEAVSVLQVLMIPTALLFANILNARLLIVADRQWVVARNFIVSLMVNVTFNLWLTPRWGATGVAWARLASSAILFSFNYLYVFRHIYRFNPFPTLWRPAFAVTIMGVAVASLPQEAWPVAVTLGAVIYWIMLRLSGAFTDSDVKRWKRILSFTTREGL